MHQTEAVRDRIQTGAFGRGVPVVRHISGVHDLGEPDQRRIACEVEFIDEYVERALAVAVGIQSARGVVGVRGFPFCRGKHLVPRHVQEFGVWIDEPSDQPRAGDPIDVGVLAGYPFHATGSLVSGAAPPAAALSLLASSDWAVPGRAEAPATLRGR